MGGADIGGLSCWGQRRRPVALARLRAGELDITRSTATAHHAGRSRPSAIRHERGSPCYGCSGLAHQASCVVERPRSAGLSGPGHLSHRADRRTDGAAGYRLSVQVTHGLLRGDRIIAASDGEIGLKIIALSGETPLTPLTANHLLNDHAREDR